MEDIKKVVNALIQDFIKVEQGNKVTPNNMLALEIKIHQAIDGQITLTPPDAKEQR